MSVNTTSERALSSRWIQPNPHDPDPAEAWVLPRHVSAWVVVQQMELDEAHGERVAEAFDLPLAAVRATMAYYERHRTAIDTRIAANRVFFGV